MHQRVEVDADAEAVLVPGRGDVGLAVRGRVRGAHVERDAVRRPGRAGLTHPLRGKAVSEQQMVHGRDSRAEVAPPGRHHAVHVAVHRRAPRFVQRRPVPHAVGKLFVDQHRVVGEPVRRVPRGPATRVLEFLRQIPVVQREPRRDPLAEQFVDQPVVERHSRLVEPAAVGLDPRPGNGKPVGVRTKILDQSDIAGHPVVVVARHVSGVPVVDRPRHLAEGVPNGRCAAVVGDRAFYLVRRRRDAPAEIRWQRVDERLLFGGHGSGIGQGPLLQLFPAVLAAFRGRGATSTPPHARDHRRVRRVPDRARHRARKLEDTADGTHTRTASRGCRAASRESR